MPFSVVEYFYLRNIDIVFPRTLKCFFDGEGD